MNPALEALLKSLRDDFRDMPASNTGGALSRWKLVAESKVEAALIILGADLA